MKKLLVTLIALVVMLAGCASQVSATEEEVTESRNIFETGMDGTQEGWQCTKIHDGAYSETCVEWK